MTITGAYHNVVGTISCGVGISEEYHPLSNGYYDSEEECKFSRGSYVSTISRISEGLQRDHRREGNGVYGAEDEELLLCASIDKGSYACECYGLRLTAGGIGGGKMLMRLDNNENS